MDTSERLDVISDTKDLVGDPPQPAERDEHLSADSVDPFEKTDGAEPLLELQPVSGLLHRRWTVTAWRWKIQPLWGRTRTWRWRKWL